MADIASPPPAAVPGDGLAAGTLAHRHAEFVAGLSFDALSPPAIDAAKLMLLDAVGCALAASGTSIQEPLRRVVAAEASGDYTVIGCSRRVAASTAAWVNGTLIHALDFDDIPHFAAVELPAAMCVLEERAGAGRDLLTAFVAGYEVAARLTASLAHGRPQHPIGLVGPIAAAVVACRLYKLPTAVIAQALGVAASHGMGLAQNFGTFTKPLHAGRAAESGLAAARLAGAGWTADPESLDGPQGFLAAYGQPGAPLDLGYDDRQPFWIATIPHDLSGGGALDPKAWPPRIGSRSPDLSRIGSGAPADRRRGGPNLRRGPSLKPWPACGGNNIVLTAALTVLLDPPLDRSSIDRIDVVLPADPSKGALFRTRPADGLQGKFGLAYSVAAAWLDGRVDVASYEADGFRRISASGLLGRVHVRVDPEHIAKAPAQPPDPDCSWCAVTLHLVDGEQRTEWAFNRGLELAREAVIAKYETYAIPVLGAEAGHRALEEILHVEHVEDCRMLIRRWAAPDR